MVVALAIGLSTISRSILEVSTSTKSEDSSRAFSAAEAGIEQAIKQNENNLGGTPTPVPVITLGNQARASVTSYSLPSAGTALNFDNVTKRDFAQFWLADPNNITTGYYLQPSFDIYFGDPDITKYRPEPPLGNGTLEDQPAIEVSTTYWDAGANKYNISRKYYDSKIASDGLSKQPRSSFAQCDDEGALVTNIDDGKGSTIPKTYYCRVTVSGYLYQSGSFPIMVRVRLLYTNIGHSIALKPIGPAGTKLPGQANIYQSSGTSGEVKRTLEVTNYRAVMPQLFDYVLFSAHDLSK